jgi:hypothetical protein
VTTSTHVCEVSSDEMDPTTRDAGVRPKVVCLQKHDLVDKRASSRPRSDASLSLIISRVRAATGFAAPIEPNCRAAAIARVIGTTDRLLVHVVKASGNRCLSGTGFSNGRIVRVSSPS